MASNTPKSQRHLRPWSAYLGRTWSLSLSLSAMFVFCVLSATGLPHQQQGLQKQLWNTESVRDRNASLQSSEYLANATYGQSDLENANVQSHAAHAAADDISVEVSGSENERERRCVTTRTINKRVPCRQIIPGENSTDTTLPPQALNADGSILLPALLDDTAYLYDSESLRFLEHVKYETQTPFNCSALPTPTSTTCDCPYVLDLIVLPRGYVPASYKVARCLCQERSIRQTCREAMSSITILRPNGCRVGMQAYARQTLEIPVSCRCRT